jgi:hypothetical protein
MVRLEGLGKLEIFSDFMGTRTHDLPACSTATQPPTLKRVPNNNINIQSNLSSVSKFIGAPCEGNYNLLLSIDIIPKSQSNCELASHRKKPTSHFYFRII